MKKASSPVISTLPVWENCLRFSIGTQRRMKILLKALEETLDIKLQ